MELNIITFGDTAKVQAKLSQYAHRGQDTLPAMEMVAKDMLRIEGIVFSSNGRRGGGSWAKLKPNTVRKKGTTEILRTVGARPGYSSPGDDALFLSLTHRGAPGQILHVSRRGIEFGSEVTAAAVAQTGAPPKNVPARPILKFMQVDVDRWSRMILDYLLA